MLPRSGGRCLLRGTKNAPPGRCFCYYARATSPALQRDGEYLHALCHLQSDCARGGGEGRVAASRVFIYCYRVAARQSISSRADTSLLSSPQSSYSTVSSAVRKDVGPIFIYNICNCVIREHDFEEALAINPRMVCLFQEQMTRVQNTAVAGADGGGNLGRIWPSGAKKEEGEEEEQKQRNKGKEKAVRSTLGNLFPRK